jgi:hypothetical protein
MPVHCIYNVLDTYIVSIKLYINYIYLHIPLHLHTNIEANPHNLHCIYIGLSHIYNTSTILLRKTACIWTLGLWVEIGLVLYLGRANSNTKNQHSPYMMSSLSTKAPVIFIWTCDSDK